MRRREYLGAMAGAMVAWPLATFAQQPSMPVIGFLDSRSPDGLTDRLRGFRQGLSESGYVEGENVTIDYRWAENRFDRLPQLAADLVSRRVAVIATSGGPAPILAAKAATTTIPIVFTSGEDAVRRGLVDSVSRPGGNLTGINFLSGELVAKRLELLREIVPTAARVAVLVNPADSTVTQRTLQEVEPAARALGLQVQTVNASTSGEINAAFANFARKRTDALFVTGDPFLNARRVQLVLMAGRQGIPAIYSGREYAEAGGLISYGSDITDAYRQQGVYVGRILRGAKPADMPVVQTTKFELVVNLQTATMLGLTVPPSLIARADEVIE
jgi:putative tryptophan/tyrosine transport system substrate-binding protein